MEDCIRVVLRASASILLTVYRSEGYAIIVLYEQNLINGNVKWWADMFKISLNWGAALGQSVALLTPTTKILAQAWHLY